MEWKSVGVAEKFSHFPCRSGENTIFFYTRIRHFAYKNLWQDRTIFCFTGKWQGDFRMSAWEVVSRHTQVFWLVSFIYTVVYMLSQFQISAKAHGKHC